MDRPGRTMGPPGAFGLLTSRYMEQFELDFDALAKIAVVQRNHALLNEWPANVFVFR